LLSVVRNYLRIDKLLIKCKKFRKYRKVLSLKLKKLLSVEFFHTRKRVSKQKRHWVIKRLTEPIKNRQKMMNKHMKKNSFYQSKRAIYTGGTMIACNQAKKTEKKALGKTSKKKEKKSYFTSIILATTHCA